MQEINYEAMMSPDDLEAVNRFIDLREARCGERLTVNEVVGTLVKIVANHPGILDPAKEVKHDA